MDKKGYNRRKASIILVVASILLAVLFVYSISLGNVKGYTSSNAAFSTIMRPLPASTPTPTPTNESEQQKQTVSTDTNSSDVELLALVTVAEAEGESEEGQRLVIDTILNRVDHPRFPNTIKDVIYAPHQFTSMWNGRVNRSHVTDDIRRLVLEEMQNRTNREVIFFRTGRYSSYGTPLFKVGNHYFSKY